MLKKSLSLILAFAMCFSMASFAFATEAPAPVKAVTLGEITVTPTEVNVGEAEAVDVTVTVNATINRADTLDFVSVGFSNGDKQMDMYLNVKKSAEGNQTFTFTETVGKNAAPGTYKIYNLSFLFKDGQKQESVNFSPYGEDKLPDIGFNVSGTTAFAANITDVKARREMEGDFETTVFKFTFDTNMENDKPTEATVNFTSDDRTSSGSMGTPTLKTTGNVVEAILYGNVNKDKLYIFDSADFKFGASTVYWYSELPENSDGFDKLLPKTDIKCNMGKWEGTDFTGSTIPGEDGNPNPNPNPGEGGEGGEGGNTPGPEVKPDPKPDPKPNPGEGGNPEVKPDPKPNPGNGGGSSHHNNHRDEEKEEQNKKPANSIDKTTAAGKALGDKKADENGNIKLNAEDFKKVFESAKTNDEKIINMDTVKGKVVEARLYINSATAAFAGKEIDTKVEISPASKENKYAKNTFEKFFDNNIRTVNFTQKGSFGFSIPAAVRVDVSNFAGNNIYLYSYDIATNTYIPVGVELKVVDANGYLHFSTSMGNTLIISDSPLKLR